MKKQTLLQLGIFVWVVAVTAQTSEKKELNASKKQVVQQEKKQELVNKIVFIVYTDTKPIIITQLDIGRKSLDGRVRTKQEVLLERILFYEATEAYKMPAPDDMVDKHLASIKEAHGISEDEIAHLFAKEGYTLQEGKQQLLMSYAIQNLVQQMIASRLVVTEKEIQAFYKEHPIKEPATFRIKKGIVKKDDMTKQQIKELQEDGLHQESVEWTYPYTLDGDEIAESKQFIKTMQPGQIRVIEHPEEYEVIMLIKRKQERVKTLDESRREIAEMIKMPKYEKMVKEFEQSVLKKYEIVDMS